MNALDRRSLLTAVGCASMVAVASGPVYAAGRKPFFARANLPVGLQIYTLGPDAGRDLDATFTSVASIGYREIELPNLLGHQPVEVAAAAARAGLKIGSLHLPLVTTGGGQGLTMGSEPSRIVDTLGALGVRWAVAPILLLPTGFRPQQGESFGDALGRSVAAAGEDIWKSSAEQLNKTASALKPSGIGVGYHNHNFEFAPIGKTTGWDILWHETDPKLVSFEVDIGWVATAGLDPVRFLEKHRGRLRLMHVKDVAKGNPVGFNISMTPAEVGSGVLDWARILPAAHRAGIRHFYVEQEPPFIIPRIEAAHRSYTFLSQLKA